MPDLTETRRAEMEKHVGYDNVQFRWRDDSGRLHMVVGTIIGVTDDCQWVVGNPKWDLAWHVAIDDAEFTELPLNSPPSDW